MARRRVPADLRFGVIAIRVDIIGPADHASPWVVRRW
jgi:hypothetical protein